MSNGERGLLETMSPEAMEFYRTPAADGRSFERFVKPDHLRGLSEKLGRPLAITDLPFGYDETVPADLLEPDGLVVCTICPESLERDPRFTPRWRNFVTMQGTLVKGRNQEVVRVGSFLVLEHYVGAESEFRVYACCDGCMDDARHTYYDRSGAPRRRQQPLQSMPYEDTLRLAEELTWTSPWSRKLREGRMRRIAELQGVKLPSNQPVMHAPREGANAGSFPGNREALEKARQEAPEPENGTGA